MLELIVGKFHVGTPDAEVRAAIAARLAPTCAPGDRKAILARAVRIHRRNRRLYAAVMGGHIR